LLEVVRKGGVRGLAYEEVESGVWQEWIDGRWDVAKKVVLRAVANTKSCAVDLTSAKDLAQFLESQRDVEEVFLVRESREARLVVRFRDSRDAKAALDLGRNLLGCEPEAVDHVGEARLLRMREQSRGSYLSTDQQRSNAAAGAGERPDARPEALRCPVGKARSKCRVAPPSRDKRRSAEGVVGVELPAAGEKPAEQSSVAKQPEAPLLGEKEMQEMDAKPAESLRRDSSQEEVGRDSSMPQPGPTKGARAKSKPGQVKAEDGIHKRRREDGVADQGQASGQDEDSPPSDEEGRQKDKKHKKEKKKKETDAELQARLRKEVADEMKREQEKPGPGRPRWSLAGALASSFPAFDDRGKKI